MAASIYDPKNWHYTPDEAKRLSLATASVDEMLAKGPWPIVLEHALIVGAAAAAVGYLGFNRNALTFGLLGAAAGAAYGYFGFRGLGVVDQFAHRRLAEIPQPQPPVATSGPYAYDWTY